MEMVVIEIDLNQIPVDKIKNFMRKNGNEANVVKFCVCKRKQPDAYGSDMSVYINQSQEERDAKAPKIYCGKGVEIKPKQQPQQSSQQPNWGHYNNDDDSPF